MMNSDLRIVIADDHPIFRKGLRQVLEMDPHIHIVAEAEDGQAALNFLEELRPEVAVIDIDMPGPDGFEIARTVQEKGLPIAIIFLTMHTDEHVFNTAFDLGVKGYVLKDAAVTEIIKGIKAVAAGQNYISSELATFLVRRSNRAGALAQEKPTLASLTRTEQRVLKLIADYKTSREIAEELCISPRTVERHRANIGEKLNLKGSHSLLKFATAHKSQL
jgi:DNA-binding NarL/FixJ family response regulator